MQRFAAFLLFFLLLGCEKDDICVDGNTPHLIIRFYDKENPELTKSVTTLRITGEGLSDPLSTVNRITTDSIAVPLRSSENNTVFSFISDSGDNGDGMEMGITDVIRFDYQTREVFVSRACGYIANYDDLNVMVTMDGDDWIDAVEITNTTIADEVAAHIKIYH
ncbi:MAG: DUF6452 family protein [Bacteroidota bacterium]